MRCTEWLEATVQKNNQTLAVIRHTEIKKKLAKVHSIAFTQWPMSLKESF